MKTYHYCAMAVTETGAQQYSSGVFTHDKDLLSAPGAYLELCDRIGEFMKPPRQGSMLALLSLTVIADDAAPRAAPPIDKQLMKS